MDNRDFDEFVTGVLNKFKEETKHYRDAVLQGNLSLEDYRYNSGVLYGVEMASQLFTSMGRKFFNEQFGEPV